MKTIKYFENSVPTLKHQIITILNWRNCIKVNANPIFLTILGLVIFINISCNKWVEVNPPNTSLTGENIYSNDATAISALNGIYSNLSANNYVFVTGISSISLECGLSADEFTLFGGSNASTNLLLFYQNDLTNASYLTFWESLYQMLLQVNSAIEGLTISKTLTPSVKDQLLGEAEFLRAFDNFYLVNLYGNVPLLLTTNYNINSKISTSPKSIVWQQIISDLNDARKILNNNFLDGTLSNNTTERVRPTKWAAYALLAKSYLYTNNWDSAELASSTVINNSTQFGLDSLNLAFLKNGAESIWQLQPVFAGQNTSDAETFIIPSGGPNTYSNPVYLSQFLLNSFEPNDGRLSNWVGIDSSTGTKYYYPFKYKSATYNVGAPITEYLTVMRLADQYLIRAEARAEKNNLIGALLDLNVIRHRAGLLNTTATTQADILKAIQHERQIEFFSEWGNRWLDLKRTGNVDSVMSIVTPQKGGTWNSTWQLYPIPLYDIQQNENISQNPGY